MASSKSPLAFIPAVVAAVVIIPAAVFLSHLADHEGENKDKGEQHRTTMTTNHGDAAISAVPEANPAIVLLPFVGAVLVFSSLHLFRSKAHLKTSAN